DRDQLVAALELGGPEALREDAADRRHERGAAGHEHTVDAGRVGGAGGEEPVDAAGGRGELGRDPRFELVAGKRLLDLRIGEPEGRVGAARGLDLGALDGAVELVGEIVVDDVAERRDPRPLRALGALEDAVEEEEVLRRLQERQMVPTLEVAEEPGRDRHLLALDAVAAAAAQLGRDEVAEDLRVEGVAGERDALDAEDLAGAAAARLGPDAEEREVAGAAAEIGDEDELVAVEAALVVVGGSDRLELEDQALLG